METGVKITLIIVGAIFLLALLGGYGFYNIIHPYNPGKTVSVQGLSTLKASPDIVTVYLTAETNASTTTEANKLNAEMVDKIITDLVKAGFERKKITTEGFSVNPWEVWENDKYVTKGYKAVHNIKVEMSSSETSLIGTVIDAGANNGAYVNYINFELSPEKQNEYKAQSLKAAAEDAKTKATAIAEGLGKSLGDIVSINQGYEYTPWRYYDYAAGASLAENVATAKTAATSIQPGEKDISAQVNVVYKIR